LAQGDRKLQKKNRREKKTKGGGEAMGWGDKRQSYEVRKEGHGARIN
jgi:hypothetical protein